ncbi:hypothetical protein P154DRAFT_443505 [Amniculicola lignicola CBS 123094]|uniref:BZIP domain-containing protein n=1 Tax=Amniculicola lignicola CBS 123094 TaxID=1392246 RepID=A0A6A5W5K0_9PLEO|nr:hypothetical protein P154DRAFT_443505 [Amniculicola lignicola CBS 123094]
MAAVVLSGVTMTTPFNSNQCIDPDTESFFDFSQLPSPSPSSGSRQLAHAPSAITSPTNTVIDNDDFQTPAKPSHEYERFKQQTGLPGSSQITDARTEETIARVVNQIRQNSQNGSLSDDGHGGLPHIVRMKKDEDDMDEDERLLNSEEGKKLSSKERRQLRNKVSARAFRSRRKEYIGQLEGEVAMKQNECNELRTQNRALMEENARSRAFIERLLRHQAFTPFLEELSRDESLEAKPTMSSTPTPAPAPARKDVNPYQNQQFGGMSQSENPQIGMALIPETQLDLSMLNLNTNNWAMNNMNSFNYQQPQVFAVLELPEGPSSPLDTQAMSGKGFEAFAVEEPVHEELKHDYPVIERPVQSEKVISVEVEDDDAPEFDLYRSSPSKSVSVPTETSIENHEPLFGDVAPEKVFAHFELFISDEADNQRLMERFERMCASMEPALQRIQAMTSHLDS